MWARQQIEALKQEKAQLSGEMQRLKGAKNSWVSKVFDKRSAYVAYSYDAGNSSLGGWLHAQPADENNASSAPGSAHGNSRSPRLPSASSCAHSASRTRLLL